MSVPSRILLYRSIAVFSSTTAIPVAGCRFFSSGGQIFQIRQRCIHGELGVHQWGQLAGSALRRYTLRPEFSGVRCVIRGYQTGTDL